MRSRRSPLVVLLIAIAPMWGLLTGCQTLPSEADIEAASTRDVQDQAWGEIKDLTATLERQDAAENPGIAALVEGLTQLIEDVEDLGGPFYDRIDVAKVITENPAYWRAMTELDASDPTLLVLEAMLTAANGKVEGASDLLEMVRAGPLTEDELDQKLVLQRRTISKWRWNPPSLDIAMVESLPPAERWEPVKRAQRMHPDSATAALAVLRMRADLAGVELTAQGEDQRMRDKILEAEPDALELLQTEQPLRAAIISAKGEASDAARRVDEMLEPDSTGILNFSEEDFDLLIADLARMDLPDWALRAAKLRMAQRGEVTVEDIEIWRQLLPELIGEEEANEMLAAWENGETPATQIYATVPEPTGTAARPINPTVGGHYERMRRDAALTLGAVLPVKTERINALNTRMVGARMIGREAEAEAALMDLAMENSDPMIMARGQLSLAMLRGDPQEVAVALEEVKRRDRRLIQTSFDVGNAEILLGNWLAAADAFERGFKNEAADPIRRGFAAMHAYGAAKLAGEDRRGMVEDALEVVPTDAWIRTLLEALLGELDREQLLAMADEGRTYIAVGQRCEALFALAFVPGQTAAGRDADLQACFETGMVGYIEYEFARHYSNRLRG